MSRLRELQLSHHPKCPGCGHVHPTTRANGVFMVKTDYCARDNKYLFSKQGEPVKCKWRGVLTEEDYINGVKRNAE